ncbi:MAG: carbamoyl-phosphate synthase large subunit [Firmicutes bacterium]|nr:carbamoyl-phosphate synthase large subunit [Bacillota bacterium]
MPLIPGLRKVLVIGSGPIIIGQAAEFDYAGSQACRSLREEGLQVVLVNSNPATIMTDLHMAEQVYLEPLTVQSVAAILERERPDGLLASLGGQTGLNLAVELSEAGVLDRLGVRLLGTPLEAIRRAEDRELFRATMQQIGEPVPESAIVHTVREGVDFAAQVGLPLVVRPAYTLGGTGGGLATTLDELVAILERGLSLSRIHQCLLERSVAGWKEIEYEVIRDGADNCITVCNMENLDPVGIHTGDSIVVAPSQTLNDAEYQMLRSAALKIIRALGVEGGCNVQFALDPRSSAYYVIEVNPRVSRSSALASKATGYPIAKVAAKIAVGLRLDEIRNAVTGQTLAAFEPALDYVVVKIPRWPFDKFPGGSRRLGTQMKATGEVMAIDRSFEAALLKALRSLELGEDQQGLFHPDLARLDDQALLGGIRMADDRRLWRLAEALRRGYSVPELAALTQIDSFFLHKLAYLVGLEQRILDEAAAHAPGGAPGRAPQVSGAAQAAGPARGGACEAAWAPQAAQPATQRALPPPAVGRDLLWEAKRAGFSDASLAQLVNVAWAGRAAAGVQPVTPATVRAWRAELGVMPVYKMVDTCAAEFAAATPYFYSTYEQEDEAEVDDRPRVVVIGSGPIRIGQGIEFDYASVHAVWALRQAGIGAIIINNNPETVSTDFDTADRLYFEPLSAEDVLNVCQKEKPLGVIVQFGGQTAINLVADLAAAGFRILGTDPRHIDQAEDRGQFDELVARLGIPRPPGVTAHSPAEARQAAARIGYPVLVRPSYVLGGRAMEIVSDERELQTYMENAARVSPHHPVWIDKYLPGVELEVDAVADGADLVIPGIMEHVERAGVHSGDSIAVFPPPTLPPQARSKAAEYTRLLARALQVKGLMNLQFVWHDGELYVLEVNPRASRTVPFLSKVTGIPMVPLAVQVALGGNLRDLCRNLGVPLGLAPEPPYVAVKVPVFSFTKLAQVETGLGPEMKSTGEVLGIHSTYAAALHKGLVAAGIEVPREGPEGQRGAVLLTVADRDKEQAWPVAQGLVQLGFELYATPGTARFLARRGLPVQEVPKLQEGDAIEHLVREHRVSLVINTMSRGRQPERDGFRIRRLAADYSVACLTSVDTAQALVAALRDPQAQALRQVRPLGDYLAEKEAAEKEGAEKETKESKALASGMA